MKKLRQWRGILFVLPSLIGVMIFYVIPFVMSFIYCFTNGISERKFVGFKHFKTLFNNPSYQLALYNTIFIIGIALPILCMLALAFALVIEKRIERYKWLQGVLLIPMALPAASLILVWKDIFTENGILNGILGMHVVWLESEYAPWIIIFMIIWKNLGYSILLLLSAVMMIPKEYEEAASLDGAGFLKVAIKIKIPCIMPMIFFTVVISLMNCFKIFREVYLLQGDYPKQNLYLLQHFMNNNFVKLNYEILSAAAFILYIIIFAIIFIVARWQEKYINENM